LPSIFDIIGDKANKCFNKEMRTKMETLTKQTATASALIEMFLEDTGQHLLDSGMSNGRNWQRNADMSFVKRPAAYMEFDEPRLSLYSFLNERLLFNKFQSDQFDFMFEGMGAGMNEMREFVEACELKSNGVVYNTFDDENFLDQQVQFLEFQLQGRHYVILQVHNGADARGGYTKPKVFTASPAWCSDLNDISLWCGDCGIPVYAYNGQIEQPVVSVNAQSKISGDGWNWNNFVPTFKVNNSILWNGCLCPSCEEPMSLTEPNPDHSF